MSEPWSFAPDIEDGPSMDWNVFDAAGTLVCVACEEDARRIVACVNACAGIPTERLEGLKVTLMKHLFGADEHAVHLVRQRDELLAALNSIADAFGIGAAAKTPQVILENALNSSRRSACLSAVEATFFTKTLEDEDGEFDDCPLGWGCEPDEYVKQFREALAAREAQS